MTKSNILFVGMDVYKESIDVAIAEDGISGEVSAQLENWPMLIEL